jgi:lipoprotein NlpI
MLRAIEARDEIYPMLFRYLARARGGANATAELEANASRLKSKAWPYAAIELYLGRRSTEATLDAAGKTAERCEAEFYIGEWHLIRGEREQARPRLQKAIDSCPKGFVEYIAGVAELKRLAK